eukprot:9467305-Pyramimonas_sp.AAC.1
MPSGQPLRAIRVHKAERQTRGYAFSMSKKSKMTASSCWRAAASSTNRRVTWRASSVPRPRRNPDCCSPIQGSDQTLTRDATTRASSLLPTDNRVIPRQVFLSFRAPFCFQSGMTSASRHSWGQAAASAPSAAVAAQFHILRFAEQPEELRLIAHPGRGRRLRPHVRPIRPLPGSQNSATFPGHAATLCQGRRGPGVIGQGPSSPGAFDLSVKFRLLLLMSA